MSITILYLSLALGADPAAHPKADLLIEPDLLFARMGQFVILDARDEKSYRDGHVPNAVRVDVPEMSKAFNTEVDTNSWAARLGDLGIEVGTPVVVYGDDWREA